MAPKKKVRSDDLRSLVIQHFQNGDSQRMIAAITLLLREAVQDTISEYKRVKCVGNLFEQGRGRRTTVIMVRTVQHTLKKNQPEK